MLDRITKALAEHRASKWGNDFLINNQLTQAIDAFTTAIRLSQGKVAAYYNKRGIAYKKSGQFGAAISDYLCAIEQDAKHAEAYINLSIALHKNGEYQKAAEYYARGTLLGIDSISDSKREIVLIHIKNAMSKQNENIYTPVPLDPIYETPTLPVPAIAPVTLKPVKVDDPRLLEAAKKGNIDLVKGVIALGGDLEIKDAVRKGRPLAWAAFQGHAEVVKLLLAAGADKDAKDEDNDTALTLASLKGHVDVVKLLLAAGVDKEVKDSYGDTALAMAAYKGHVEVIKILLAAGADKEIKNINGRTILMRAAFYGHAEVVRILLAAGADKEAKDNQGRTALALAKEKEHVDIANILLGVVPYQERIKGHTGNIPEQLSCAISSDIMNDPITVSSGHTYDRESLREWSKKSTDRETFSCPKTGLLIKRDELKNKTNIAIKNLIEEFVTLVEEQCASEQHASDPVLTNQGPCQIQIQMDGPAYTSTNQYTHATLCGAQCLRVSQIYLLSWIQMKMRLPIERCSNSDGGYTN